MINSHIILPKFLLKNFEIDHFFWYYDINGDFIAKGNAGSFNTEKGYYSDGVEQTLNSEVETPFSNLLNEYSNSIHGDDEFELPEADILLINRFFYSLLSRNPQMVERVNSSSVFYQFLEKTDQHGYAAIAGIGEGERINPFKEYDVTFFINRTDIPFVLPNCGIYNLNLRGSPAIVFPVSPDVLFVLWKDMVVEKEGTIEVPRGLIAEETVIKRMNIFALKQQVSMNGGGRIICSQKEELERLKEEYNQDVTRDGTVVTSAE